MLTDTVITADLWNGCYSLGFLQNASNPAFR
jgi:hypothetical protein